MKSACFLVVAGVAMSAAAIAADNSLAPLKGKMKEGSYNYKMEMDMPGGMGKRTMEMQKCVTNKDIEGGDFSKRQGEPPANCEIKNFNMSGNTATYKMVCTDPEVTGENKITFDGDSHVMEMKMAMKREGQVMNISQRMESTYLGPCK